MENLYFAGTGDDYDDLTCILSEIRVQMEVLEYLADAWSRYGFGGSGYAMVCGVQDYVSVLADRFDLALENCRLGRSF